LTDGKAVANLLKGEVLQAVKGKKILNASTTGIDEISNLAKTVKEHGGSLSEISIMVGPEQVREQEAYFMLGCPEEEESFWNEVLGKDGAVQSIGESVPGAEYLLPNITKRNYDECMASTESLIGVADAAISTAEQISMPAKLLEDMRELFVKATDAGYGEKDASSVVEILLEDK
jgi:3-hydroxyisobutyrate dehydrogenase-like beta-hydroxyacid dehydrogenase